jgi:hypothetical protein
MLVVGMLRQTRNPRMSRMEAIDLETATVTDVVSDAAVDRDLQLWLKMGRAAFFFCLWTSMVMPIALIYSVRF